MITDSERQPLTIGALEVRPADRQVLVNGQPLEVGSRAFDVLEMLASEAGRVVDSHDLRRKVWRGRRVVDNNLQVQIAALRRALGPNAIVTVPGRGYQLTGRSVSREQRPG